MLPCHVTAALKVTSPGQEYYETQAVSRGASRTYQNEVEVNERTE